MFFKLYVHLIVNFHGFQYKLTSKPIHNVGMHMVLPSEMYMDINRKT